MTSQQQEEQLLCLQLMSDQYGEVKKMYIIIIKIILPLAFLSFKVYQGILGYMQANKKLRSSRQKMEM